MDTLNFILLLEPFASSSGASLDCNIKGKKILRFGVDEYDMLASCEER